MNSNDTGHLKRRIKVSAFVISLLLVLLIIRLGQLQIIRGEELRQRSENNSIKLRKIIPLRGLILDTRGHILVENKPSFDLNFIPNPMSSPEKVIAEVRRLYKERNIHVYDFQRLPTGNFFVPVKVERAISREKLAVIETNSHVLPGLQVDVVPMRNYLLGEMTAHILGYMGEISREELAADKEGGYSAGDLIGKSGLEKTLNRFLKGENGAEQVEVNVAGKKVKVIGRLAAVGGYHAVLHLDLSLQQIAWEALGGKTGAVVVMDPRNGAVLAMVSSPSFDPNLFNEGISRQNWLKLTSNHLHPLENRAIAGQYPPASTYKLFVAAAALEEGLVEAETSFFCNGKLELGKRAFRCWRKEGHGRLNLHRAIVESCDVYFYHLGKMLGVDTIAKYAARFGFGERTGIDLPQEKKGLLPTKKWKQTRYREAWHIGDTLSVAIGQGYNLVTPLQLANAYSALANGGKLYRPQIIKRLLHPDGRIYREFPPEVIGNLGMGVSNMQILRRALWGVVNERGGTGYALRRAEGDVSGKTGTAQAVTIPQEGMASKFRGSHLKTKDHALFVCYAPENNPEITVAVVLEHAGVGGGAGAAPVARKIVDAYFAQRPPWEERQMTRVLSSFQP